MRVNNPASAADLTKEFYVPVTYESGGISASTSYPVASLGTAPNYACTSFKVPHDFSVILSAELIVIPITTQANNDWDISSDYGALGESKSQHSEADAVTTYNTTAYQLFAVDISGILTALAADDFVGIKLLLSNSAHDVQVLGVRFRYS